MAKRMFGRSEITKLMILLPLFHAFDKSIGIWPPNQKVEQRLFPLAT
jgi:hypothetical protein